MQFRQNFGGTDQTELKWMNPPKKCYYGSATSPGLVLTMDEKSDFWQRTMPGFQNDNGHIFYKEISDNILLETRFHLKAINKYDQAGLAVYLNSDCWLKTGIEYLHGQHHLSVVVTNHGFSDWSVQKWDDGNLSIRLLRYGSDFVVEAKSPEQENWDFIRICHLFLGNDDQQLKMGLCACAPTGHGGQATFDFIDYQELKEEYDKH